jgi:hypothetical protein
MRVANPRRKVLVVTARDVAAPARFHGAKIVTTPLDMIMALDGTIDLVVLAGVSAHDAVLGGFLREHYPELDVVALRAPADAMHPYPDRAE